MTLQLGVLVSGTGTNLGAVIDAIAQKQLDASIRTVISNRPAALALERAAKAGIPTRVIEHRHFPSRRAFDQALVAELKQQGVEWVLLAGFMRLLSPTFLEAFPFRVVNVHPSLLPAFPGMDAQQQAFEHGVKISGCTVHLVDVGTDTGPVIAQAAVPVLEDDDVERLRQRILVEEHRLVPLALELIASGRANLVGRKVVVAGGQPTDEPGALRNPS